MTQAALLVGSFLVAFGPMLAIFSLIVYHKAQLVILVTTSAFFYLLAATTAALVWTLFDLVGLGGGVSAILPGVLFQFLFRCGYTQLYHKVEHVIHVSLQKQNELEQQQQQDSNNNHTSLRHGDAQNRPHEPQPSSPRGGSWAEAAKLRLQLNDASAAIASGVGFGGMNAILLYGTLWASETSNAGVLYENSCPSVPSLAVSALLANFFFVLQTFWMLMTFFGMRRRQLYHRGEAGTTTSGFWGNSRHGGNWALLASLLTHLLSSLLTLTNALTDGCRISVPAVGGVVLLTAYLFWAGCGRHYMPPMSPNDPLAFTMTQQPRHWD